MKNIILKNKDETEKYNKLGVYKIFIPDKNEFKEKKYILGVQKDQ